jgi:hypothetical protein
MHLLPNHGCPAQSVKDIIMTLINKQEEVNMKVDPYEGYESSLIQEELKKARIERVKKSIAALQKFSSRISKERKRGDPLSFVVATEDKNFFKVNMFSFLDSPLSIVHTALASEFTTSMRIMIQC